MSIKDKAQNVCLCCGGKNFTAKKIIVGGFCIKCVAWVCDNCDAALMDSEQMNECLEKV